MASISSKSSESSTTAEAPLHFTFHKPGFHFESCCGICNLFPGVILIGLMQITVGMSLLYLILTNGNMYDELHLTTKTQMMSTVSGVVLSSITGSGFLLLIVALTENCRAMVVYLMVSIIVFFSISSLAGYKISNGCTRFGPTPRIKDYEHRMANLACASGLFTFMGAILHMFAFMVVFSFYHFRYVRRAIILHEAECNLKKVKDTSLDNV